MLEHFHFLEPLWFLALIPLLCILWLAFQASTDSKAWEKVIDPKLLPLLLKGEDNNSNLMPKLLLSGIWIMSVIALADPVWEKVARPIFQTNAARVIVLDLSNSMLIDDLKPSRLARARFKIEDILSREEEGQTGLVLFAGEAFTAAPLTRDTETIRSMLKVLSPQIMPAQGSRADLGLIKAHDLLKQAGISNGLVLLIADGISQQSLGLNAAKNLRNAGHTLSVMAVGTEAGGKLNFRNNTNVTVKLDANSLSEIAKSGGGNYHLISTNSSDLKSLLSPISSNNSLDNSKNKNNEDLQNREWKSTGPYLVLILLPFAALAFRRGWLLSISVAFVIFGLVSHPQPVIAAENESIDAVQNAIEVLTKNTAQRVDIALNKKQYEKVLKLTNEPLSKGSAEYKLEKYEEALQTFKQAQGAAARYNEGNTLAKLEKYNDAISAYDEALKINPDMKDASENKKMIQDFLKQQQSKNNQQSSNKDQQGNSDSQNSQQDQQNGDSKQNQDDKNGSQSAENKNDDKGEQDQQQSEKDNQFSDANENADKNKEEAESEEVQSSAEQSNDAKSESDKQQALADQEKSEEPIDSDIQQTLSKEQQLAEELSNEEKMAAEQWLRRIPDDPGGLLKRKFRHQYNQTRRNRSSTEQPW